MAQETSSEPDEFELSPFIVRPVDGWYADETLVGTRLKSSYHDLAQQIETLTAMFLDEYGLTSVEEAAIYLMNVENRDEYIRGPGADRRLRIRGLDTPTYSRMFFNSNFPTDSYNVERFDIAYGPNPVIFGMGSPGGIINAQLQSAIFREQDFFKMRLDSNGSHRMEVHANRELIDDVLALRASLLYNQQEFTVEPSGELDRRFYTATTYRPFKKSMVRAYFETARISTQFSSRLYPYDEISPWIKASQLPDSGYDVDRPIFSNSLDWYYSGQKVDTQLFEDALNAPVFVIDNGNNGGYTHLASWGNSVVVKPLQDWDHISPLNSTGIPYTFLNDDYFPTDLALQSALGGQEMKGDSFNLLFIQEILENLHLEVAYHQEHLRYSSGGSMGDISTIRVDANAFLPDNVTPNPNAGKYYIQGNSLRYPKRKERGNEWIGALSYQHDFTDSGNSWIRWLGRHTFVGTLARNFQEERSGNFMYRIFPKQLENGQLVFPEIDNVDWYYPYSWDSQSGTIINKVEGARFMTQDNTRLMFRYYLDPASGDFIPSLPFTVGEPLQLIDSAGNPFTIDPENTGFRDEEGRRLVMGGWSSHVRNKTYSMKFSYQGHFWKDRIVYTFGWSRNKVEYALPVVESDDPYTGLERHFEDVPFGEWVDSDEGDSTIMGLVVAPFRDWLKLPLQADIIFTGQRSKTFQDNTGNYSPFGVPYPGAVGESIDRGIGVSLFNGRIDFRYNRYTNTASPIKAANRTGGIVWRLGAIEDRIRELDPDLPLIEGPNGFGFNTLDAPYIVVSDQKAVGHEFAVQINLTQNFQIRCNASFSEAVESNIGHEWWEWMDQRIEMYRTLDVPEGGTYNPQDIDHDGKIGRWTWDTARYHNARPRTLAEQWEQQVIKGQFGKELIQSLEGRSNPFIRNLRFNVNFMYRFKEGKYRGSAIGGAFRWREAPLLSYGPRELNGVETIDLTKPLYGEKEYYLDLTFRYKLRSNWAMRRWAVVSLNIRNVFDRDDPIPVEINVDGQPTSLARVEGIQFVLDFRMNY
ncbi:MAG TPA: TonB-dependent receptor [Oceanipulchritudo sp.]|nr:TonB-dependent receptor [Oceanipulchritudo sp.]